MWKWSMPLRAVLITALAVLTGPSQAKFRKLPSGGDIKAVLIAGAKYWKNYSIQANVCHAYQVLRGNGIPEENIIVMMYDDIAFNEKNPHKGVIINRPDGPNVYKNVKKDYVGKDVNKEVFFNVLLGNKEAVNGKGSGRVLESGPNDHVFVYYVDHGYTGMLFMPDYNIITSKELLEKLNEMAKTSRFKKMFFYIEACYSGSMVELLPDNLNIFVMTSASPNEECRQCFCNVTGPDSMCLGSEFGYNWKRDAETVDLRKETIQQQFQTVWGETVNSNVQEYGDINISTTKVSEVLGHRDQLLPRYEDVCYPVETPHQVPVTILERSIQAAKDPEEKKRFEKELQDLQQARTDIVQFFSKLAEDVLTPAKMDLYEDTIRDKSGLTKTNLACYGNAVTHLNDNCFKLNSDPFIGTQLHILINLCNLVPEAQIVEKILAMCHDKPIRQAIF